MWWGCDHRSDGNDQEQNWKKFLGFLASIQPTSSALRFFQKSLTQFVTKTSVAPSLALRISPNSADGGGPGRK
jgi:hypothetical protein